MPLSQEMLSQLRAKAIEKANEIMSDILKAYHNPQVSLSGESLRVWNELEAWGWLEEFPIDAQSSKSMYHRLIAMSQFRQLKWEEENPKPENQMSKWEKVVGRAGRR